MTAAGWYPGPTGTVLRWWTGWAWGPDVAGLGEHPLPPPAARRYLPWTSGSAAVVEALETQALTLPATADLPIP